MQVEPIGYVKSERKDAIDDDWDSVSAFVELDSSLSEECLKGLDAFSHAEILYLFHKADPRKIVIGTEHPRENPDFPSVGIFAQRKKERPNLIGATICEIVKIEGRRLYLKRLDAIDGTPVLDIKPVYREFMPTVEVKQPAWVSQMMKDYW
jgi:tRNA-Thr(GGU) m(6)t(6)A37 methyltransferase TsaA